MAKGVANNEILLQISEVYEDSHNCEEKLLTTPTFHISSFYFREGITIAILKEIEDHIRERDAPSKVEFLKRDPEVDNEIGISLDIGNISRDISFILRKYIYTEN